MIKVLSVNCSRKSKFNFALFFLMFLLLSVGLIFVYSASYYSAGITYQDKFFFVKKQIFGIVVGLVFYLFFSFFDYHNFDKLKYVFWKQYILKIV